MAGGEDDSALGLGNSTTGESGLSNETLEHVQQMAREELQERLQRQEEELLQLRGSLPRPRLLLIWRTVRRNLCLLIASVDRMASLRLN